MRKRTTPRYTKRQIEDMISEIARKRGQPVPVQWHPFWAAMTGLGIVVVALFLTAIILISR